MARKRRTVGSIDKLQSALKDTVDQILYKKGVDMKAKNDEKIALEANQNLLYDTLKKENPKLYTDLQEIILLKQKAKDGGTGE